MSSPPETVVKILEADLMNGVDPDRLENVREVCTKLVRFCGLWGATMPVADLAVALTQGKVMFELGVTTPDPAIDHQSLVPGMKKTFWSLQFLSQHEKTLFTTELGMAMETLDEWLWADLDGDFLDGDFHRIACETRMVFSDCRDLFKYVPHQEPDAGTSD